MTRQSFIFVCLLISVVVAVPAVGVLAVNALQTPMSTLAGWPGVPRFPTSAVPLKPLAQQMSLPLVQVGGHLYWLSPPRHLREILPGSNAIRFELSGFAPVDIEQGANSLNLTFRNTLTLLPDQNWPWRSVWLSGAQTITDPVRRQVRVRLALTSPVGYRLMRYWSKDASVIEIKIATAPTKPTPLAAVSDAFEYQAVYADTAAGKTTVHAVSVPDVNARYHLVPLLSPDGLGTLLPLSQLLKQGGVALAINANFFDPLSKMPIGLLIQNSRLERVDYARRGALGVDVFGNLHFWHPNARGWIKVDGQTLDLDGLNRPPRTNELVLLSSAYGRSVALPEAATVVRVQRRIVRSIEQASTFRPDRQSDYLIATGAARVRLAGVQPGTPVAIGYSLSPAMPAPMKYAWGAGPMLVQGGQVVLDAGAESFDPAFASGRAARSAIGLTANGTLLLVMVAQDRDNAGMTLAELAQWMQTHGASSALALDGGGSASLSFRQGVQWYHLGGTRPVAVGLGLVPR